MLNEARFPNTSRCDEGHIIAIGNQALQTQSLFLTITEQVLRFVVI